MLNRILQSISSSPLSLGNIFIISPLPFSGHPFIVVFFILALSSLVVTTMSHVVLDSYKQSVLQHPSGIHLPSNPPNILHSVLMHLYLGLWPGLPCSEVLDLHLQKGIEPQVRYSGRWEVLPVSSLGNLTACPLLLRKMSSSITMA